MQAGTARDGRVRGKRRGLFAVAAIIVVAAAALGVTLATGNAATKNTAATTVPSQNAASAAQGECRRAGPRIGRGPGQRVGAGQRVGLRAGPQAGGRQGRGPARHHLPVASVAAYGPDGFADGDNPGNANNAIARTPPSRGRLSGTSRRTSGC